VSKLTVPQEENPDETTNEQMVQSAAGAEDVPLPREESINIAIETAVQTSPPEDQAISYTPPSVATILEVDRVPNAASPVHPRTPVTRSKKKGPHRSLSKPEALSPDELSMPNPDVLEAKKKRQRGRPRTTSSKATPCPTKDEEVQVLLRHDESKALSDENVSGGSRDALINIEDVQNVGTADPKPSEMPLEGDVFKAKEEDDTKAVVKVEVPRRKASEATESVDNVVETKVPTPTVARSKKRGRGRPRKAALEAPVEILTAEPDVREERDAITDVQLPLNGISGNGLSVDFPEVDDKATMAIHDLPAEADSGTETTAAIETNVTPKLQVKPEVKPRSSSPVSKNKVPLRVGLSRHARLPSLLKIVRK
jgi:hypothetical protein